MAASKHTLEWTTGVRIALGILALLPYQAQAEYTGGTATNTSTQQQQPSSGSSGDRNSQQNTAAAMAAIAAGIAAMSCMEMYQAADEAEAAGNSQLAQQYRMMAAQQCAQAAQNAANSGQNQGGADQISQPNFAPSTQNTGTSPDTGTSVASTPAPSTPTVEAPPPETSTEIATGSNAVSPSTFNSTTSTLAANDTTTPLSGTTALEGIPRANLTVDDSATPASGLGGSSAANSPYGFASSNTTGTGSSTGTGTGSDTRVAGRGKGGSQENAAASGSGSDSSEASESANPLRAMLANLMKDPNADAGAAGTPIGAMIAARLAGAKKVPNIFEYASYRYRKLVREGEIRTAKPGTKPRRALLSAKR